MLDALEILKNFDQLSDDAVVSGQVTALVLGMTERTLRRHPPVSRIQTSPQRYGFRVGDIRRKVRNPQAAA